MQQTSLPESIRNDISIYLAPEEKILKAIKSGAGKTVSKGQVWLILSSNSVFFHTCETGKEPVIALLARRDIREIEYFQRVGEVVLTFVPERSPQNITRLNFANEQRPELEDFCDDLADLINFKKETAGGVKTYSTAATEASDKTPDSARRSAASAIKHLPVAESDEKPKIEPVMPESAKSEVKPEVKIVKPSFEAAKPAGKPALESAAAKPELRPADSIRPGVSPALQATAGKTAGEKLVAGVSFGYVVAATVISVLVGYLWYKFFSLLSGGKNRD